MHNVLCHNETSQYADYEQRGHGCMILVLVVECYCCVVISRFQTIKNNNFTGSNKNTSSLQYDCNLSVLGHVPKPLHANVLARGGTPTSSEFDTPRHKADGLQMLKNNSKKSKWRTGTSDAVQNSGINFQSPSNPGWLKFSLKQTPNKSQLRISYDLPKSTPTQIYSKPDSILRTADT